MVLLNPKPQQVRLLASAADGAAMKPANLWCLGRAYLAHMHELGNTPAAPTEAPMIFLKAGSTLVPPGQAMMLPSWSSDVHHEVELALELDEHLKPVRGAVALDMTARDVQEKLKQKRWPWTLSKSFPHSTALGPSFALHGLDLHALRLELTVNGKVRQEASTKLMIYTLSDVLQYVRQHFPVLPGDVLLTGTPAGVAAVKHGDQMEAKVLCERTGKVLSASAWDIVQA